MKKIEKVNFKMFTLFNKVNNYTCRIITLNMYRSTAVVNFYLEINL